MSTATPIPSCSALKEFWDFTRERQLILDRKVAGEPRPWTTDKVLDDYFFCNTRRIDDTGTKKVLQMMGNCETFEDYLFNVLLYRTFNLIGTYEDLVWVHTGRVDSIIRAMDFDLVLGLQVLENRKQKGQKIFTGAFMTAGIVNAAQVITGINHGKGYQAVLRYVDMLRQAWVPAHAKAISLNRNRWTNLRDIFESVLELDGFGRFLAYQVSLDLAYWLVEYRTNNWNMLEDFTVLGPGADAGLKIIYPSAAPRELYACIKHLRTTEPKLPYHLHLCDIEHTLCEFAKYHRVKYGTGGATRRYREGESR